MCLLLPSLVVAAFSCSDKRMGKFEKVIVCFHVCSFMFSIINTGNPLSALLHQNPEKQIYNPAQEEGISYKLTAKL